MKDIKSFDRKYVNAGFSKKKLSYAYLVKNIFQETFGLMC